MPISKKNSKMRDFFKPNLLKRYQNFPGGGGSAPSRILQFNHAHIHIRVHFFPECLLDVFGPDAYGPDMGSFYKDNYCDGDEYNFNIESCNYDGGDCCDPNSNYNPVFSICGTNITLCCIDPNDPRNPNYGA